jgi:hypothetical protein
MRKRLQLKALLIENVFNQFFVMVQFRWKVSRSLSAGRASVNEPLQQDSG